MKNQVKKKSIISMNITLFCAFFVILTSSTYGMSVRQYNQQTVASHTVKYEVPSITQTNTLQLAKLYSVCEGKIPVSLLLARGCSPGFLIPSNSTFDQPPVAKTNATFTNAPPIPLVSSQSQIPNQSLLKNDHLFNMGPPRPGRECFGQDHINQREGVLSAVSSGVKTHPYGQEILYARKILLQQEIKEVISTLREAIQPSFGPEMSTSLASTTAAWFKLTKLTVSVPDLNEKLKSVIASIHEKTGGTFDSNPMLFLPAGVHDPQALKYLQKQVDSFEKDAIKWLNNSREFDIICYDQADRYIRHYQEELTYGVNTSQLYSLESWKFLQPEVRAENPKMHQRITNHPFYKTFNEIESLAKAGKFAEASKIGSTLKKDLNYVEARAVYQKHFYDKYTPENIEKKYTNNPYYLAKKQELAAQSIQDFPVPHELNSFLEQTEKLYSANKTALGITKTNPLIDEIIYKVAEIPSDATSVASLINSYGLSRDHIEPLKQQAYEQFYSKNGLLRVFQSQDERLKQIPEAIGNTIYHRERELLNSVAACKISTQEQARLFSHMVDYLTQGIKQNNSDYLMLAHLSGNALVQPKAQNVVNNLANYAKPLENLHHHEIPKATLKFITERITSIQNADPNDPSISSCLSAIHKVDNAYKALQDGDLRAEFYLEKALTPTFNNQVLSIDYDSQIADLAGINSDQIVAKVQAHKGITEVLLKNGAVFELKEYQLPATIQEFLISRGLDPKEYSKCYGHQLQQAIHLDILKQVVKQKDLSGLALINSSGLSKLRDLSTKVTDMSRTHNKLGNVEQAGLLSNFCWQVMHHVETAGKYGIDTVVGVGEGIVKGGQSVVHTVTHPMEVIEGAANLSIAAGKTVLKLAQAHEHMENLSPFKSHEENLKIEAQFFKACEESGIPAVSKHIFNQIKSNTWRENVRDGTALVVENYITGKAITAAGNLVQATGINTQALTERLAHSLKVPVTSVATAEGIEIKVAQAAQNCALSEAPQIAKGPNTSSQLVTTKLEVAESTVVSKAEQVIPVTIENLKSTNTIYERLSKLSNEIWKKITPTQEFWNSHSLIPKSFEIEVEGKRFWVHPNATEHIMELTSPLQPLRADILASTFNLPAKQTLLSHEMLLTDFYDAINMAIKSGNIYQTENVLFNGWEIGINPSRTPGGHPVIVHAFKKVF